MKFHPEGDDLPNFPPKSKNSIEVRVSRWWCMDDTEYGCNCEQVQISERFPGVVMYGGWKALWVGTYVSWDNDKPREIIDAEYTAACKFYGIAEPQT